MKTQDIPKAFRTLHMQDHHSTDHTMPAEAETSGLTTSSNLLHRHCVNASRYVNRKARLLRSSYEGLSFLNSPLSCNMQRRYVNLLIFHTRVKIARVQSCPSVLVQIQVGGLKARAISASRPKKITASQKSLSMLMQYSTQKLRVRVESID